ncbi:MAG: ABC transporter ATP-binding protein [Clostridiaceae bacterium]
MHSSFKKNIKLIITGIKEVQNLQPWILTVTILDSLFKSIYPFVNIYMTARIIDELLGSKNIERLIYLVSITISLNLIIYLISSGLDHLAELLRHVMDHNQDMKLNEKIISMDYEYVENPEVHSLRTKIAESQNFNGGGTYALIYDLGELVKGFVTVVTSIALVINLFTANMEAQSSLSFINSRLFSFGFLALILIGTISGLRLRTISNNKFFEYNNKIMDFNRIFTFYFNQALDYNVGKEIRLCNQGEIIKEETEAFTKRSGKVFNDLANTDAKYIGTESFLSSLLSGFIYIFVGLKAVTGAITIGSIVQYAGSINQFMTGSREVLESINKIINNNKYLQLYIDFINIKSEKHFGKIPVEKRDDDEYEIEFRNVSFKYPGTEAYTLKNVSIKLNIGERLAIVGMNGSGKTTFIKLLCRLYDPSEGEILLNGIDIKKYDYDEYMKLFSVVFQDFKLFSFSLGQNTAAAVNYNEKSVKDVLEKVGLEKRLNTMIKGVHTPLYKDFDEDGVEISGGEAQKIALARALYRDAPIIILDEPTAALDPISEFEIYSKFNEIVGTKTAFYISHRLSSCRFCDEIAVFNEGKIIQKGSHEELLRNEQGKYYELWHSQAKYYSPQGREKMEDGLSPQGREKMEIKTG